MTALARLAAAALGTPAAVRASTDSKLAPGIKETVESDAAERRNRSASTSTSRSNESIDEHRQRRQRRRRRREFLLSLLGSSSASLVVFPTTAARASIPTKNVIKSLPPGTRLRPPPPRGKEDSVSVAEDAATVRRLILEARAKTSSSPSSSPSSSSSPEKQDWSAARALYLEAFSFFSPSRKERRIASAEVARVSAALALVELGEPEGALLELEDALAEGTPALRGSGEIHAALAALRYSLRRKGAENELGEATALEPRWGDEKWVKERAGVDKGWPPSMVSRLVRFLQLD